MDVEEHDILDLFDSEAENEDDANRYGQRDDEAIEVPEKRPGGGANLELSAANEGGQQEGGDKGQEKVKRIIRNPMPKLNPERITGPRGIACLEEIFKDFKPKGKGHEFDDLEKMMKKMEHWAHRLYPKLPFDDVTNRISVLGKKMAVQSYVKKLRMGMVHAINDKPINSDNEDDDSTARYDVPNSPVRYDTNDKIPDDDDIFQQLIESAETTTVIQPSQNSLMTEDQRERMRKNQLLAAEKRRHKEINSQSLLSYQSDASLTQTRPQINVDFSENIVLDCEEKRSLQEASDADKNVAETQSEEIVF